MSQHLLELGRDNPRVLRQNFPQPTVVGLRLQIPHLIGVGELAGREQQIFSKSGHRRQGIVHPLDETHEPEPKISLDDVRVAFTHSVVNQRHLNERPGLAEDPFDLRLAVGGYVLMFRVQVDERRVGPSASAVNELNLLAAL